MRSFRYVAITNTGELTRGVMEAANEAEVVVRLQRQGSMPMRTEPDTPSFVSDLLQTRLGRGRALRRQETANFTRELATMLSAGQDLDRALRFLAETAPNQRVHGVVAQLRDVVQDGSALAAALAMHPRSFSRLYIGMVRAGEAGGTLAATLGHLADLLERERRLASSISSAMVYPAVLMVAATGSIALLLTQVLPQFVPMFEQAGAALPRPTRILIAVGEAASGYGLYGLLGLLLLLLAVRQMLQRPRPRLLADRLILRVPVLGQLVREAMAARFTRTLGTLLVNGVQLIGALGIVKDAIGNTSGVAAVEHATMRAKSGAGLSRPLGETGVFPTRTIHLLRLGEETAQLGAMSLRAAEIHEEKVRLGLQRLVALLVPAITIVMGAAVAGIVASLLLAMLSLNDLAQ